MEEGEASRWKGQEEQEIKTQQERKDNMNRHGVRRMREGRVMRVTRN